VFSMYAPTGSSSRDRSVTIGGDISRWCRVRIGSIPGITQISQHLRAPLEAEEEHARSRGWQVERGRWGSRAYRDPRFDSLDRHLDTATVVPAVVR
jgi:hypothetical protein